MIKASVTEFVRKAMSKGRISFGDVQRLQRDILPNGLASREDAELLFDLDRGVSKADPSWRGWLVFTTVDFVVWAERPTGRRSHAAQTLRRPAGDARSRCRDKAEARQV